MSNRFSAAKIFASAAAALLMVGPAAADTPAVSSVTALLCGHLIDTVNGKVLGETTVLIESGRVREVLNGIRAPAGAAAIDLKSQTCLPGLIDSHVHLTGQTSRTQYVDVFHWNIADYAIRSTVYARRTLLAGFTTVRNVGDEANESASLRNAINAGIVPGPRIYTAGKAIGSTGGHADPTNGYRQDLAKDLGPADGIINSPEDAVKAVREHYKLGDDLIKIMPSGGVLDEGASGDNSQMTLEEIRAVVATAHDYGFAVAAHAHGAEAIRRAVLAGVDSIEHGTFMDEQDMKLMVEHGTFYVPTIIAGDFVARQAKVPGYYPPQIAAKAAAIGPLIQATAGRAYKAHVKIAFGTDAAVYPHGENAHEFELMVGAGMPPMFVLQAATVSAEHHGRQDCRRCGGARQSDRRHQPDETSEFRDEGRRGVQAEFAAGDDRTLTRGEPASGIDGAVQFRRRAAYRSTCGPAGVNDAA
jgi:imidazolonepropionase-like amidohydrolase